MAPLAGLDWREVNQGVRHRIHRAEDRLREGIANTYAQGKHKLNNAGQRMRSTPDWIRRSVRLSLALSFFGLMGHTVHWHPEYADKIKQSCNWAAITCVVVTAPLIGKVAEVSVYRIIGTIIGGAIGYLAYSVGYWCLGLYGAGIVVSCFSWVVVVPTVYLAYKHQADQLSKFVQLTYIIIAFNAKPEKGAAILAALRVAGIISGGIMSLLLAVIILPRSATVESCREMKKALKALVELNRAVWSFSTSPVPSDSKVKARKGGVMDRLNKTYHTELASTGHHGLVHAFKSDADLHRTSEALHSILNSEESKREGEVEKMFSTVYNTLNKVEDMLASARGEVFIHQFWGYYMFLPSWIPLSLYGITFKQPGKWHLPYEDMDVLITVVRRIARLLWSLLLDFEDGWDTTMRVVLAQYYPTSLMSELSHYCHRSLLDLATAFPNCHGIEIDNLMNLGQIVECLLHISNARNKSNGRPRRKRQSRLSPNVGTTTQPSVLTDALDQALSRSSPPKTCSDQAAQLAPQSSTPLAFVSRQLSAAPGEVSLLELPPRRLARMAMSLSPDHACASGLSPLLPLKGHAASPVAHAASPGTHAASPALGQEQQQGLGGFPLPDGRPLATISEKTLRSLASSSQSSRSSSLLHPCTLPLPPVTPTASCTSSPCAVDVADTTLVLQPAMAKGSTKPGTAGGSMLRHSSSSPFASSAHLCISAEEDLGTGNSRARGQATGAAYPSSIAKGAHASTLANAETNSEGEIMGSRLASGEGKVTPAVSAFQAFAVVGGGLAAAAPPLSRQHQPDTAGLNGWSSQGAEQGPIPGSWTPRPQGGSTGQAARETEEAPLLPASAQLSDMERASWLSGQMMGLDKLGFGRTSAGSMQTMAAANHVLAGNSSFGASSAQAGPAHSTLTMGVQPRALAARLESLMANVAVEPVTFPATEEGFVSQVALAAMAAG
ncbi:Fusaric acid resistance protein-like-domain-containing protein [Haematococcus lacustris]